MQNNALLTRIKNRLQRLKNSILAIPLKLFAKTIVEKQWKQKRAEPLDSNHGLPGQLFVNLTSFPPRFDDLHLTLKSLLLQKIQPDQIILWLYEPDIDKLPISTLELQKHGLLIKGYPTDIRSYKKLVPALESYPDAFHVTADDDIYYRPNWLEELVNGYVGDNKEVLCLRAHQIKSDANGNFLPYSKWKKKTELRGPSNILFYTSGAGVLIPPQALSSDVINHQLFLNLAPNADDVWLYWMTRLNNSKIRRVGSNPKLITWPSSKKGSLWQKNKQVDSGNDKQFASVSNFYTNRNP